MKDLNDEVVNLEQAYKNDEKVAKGKKYQYRVNETDYISDTETKTGREILELAGFPVDGSVMLRQKVKGNWETIALTIVVDFTTPGLEKFKTIKNEHTEGSLIVENAKSLRRDFVLLEEDVEFLSSLNLPWETLIQRDAKWVMVHEYPIVEGYNIQSTTIAFRIAPTYPTTQIDMVYFHPKLSRADGQPISCLSDLAIDGKMFQQWSRHRTAASAWRPGIDNLSTHYPLVEAWLISEFQKRPRYAKSA